ncbi:MAG: hypothetical protein QOG54_482 [Actinomycetota bacterium]|jgi:uncharacterized protein (TIGR03083 family)|nr:hypothetical protein [Actinomycetota bacterium]
MSFVNKIRNAFIETSQIASELLATDAVRDSWVEPSALERWNVSGLAGHLMRATRVVEDYLDKPEPEGPPTGDAVAYYSAVLDDDDLDSELHKSIRERGDEMASSGHASLLDQWRETIGRLAARLEAEPPGRLVEVFKGFILELDDYLVTRILELVVHSDDLAVSVKLPTPVLPPLATEATIRALVDMGRHRHGDTAVVRALARRERDGSEALRVL